MGGVSKKRKSRRALSKIFHISTWKLILVLILLIFLSATLLRFDHIKMSELREAVLAADEKEDDERILSSLNELRNFTLKHIVFNILEERLCWVSPCVDWESFISAKQFMKLRILFNLFGKTDMC